MPRSVMILALLAMLVASDAGADAALLATPRQLLQSERVDFVGKNAFALERSEFGEMVRSTPQSSASGLYKKLNVDGRQLSRVHWTWRVDTLQLSADLRRLPVEDSGATIFFIFGEPSFFNRDVPTLAYVWSSTPAPPGTMINSQRYDSLRYVQMHGPESVGTWKSETRDVTADYRKAFHREPDALRYVAVFNDNDQTGEPCSALFGSIEAE